MGATHFNNVIDVLVTQLNSMLVFASPSHIQLHLCVYVSVFCSVPATPAPVPVAVPVPVLFPLPVSVSVYATSKQPSVLVFNVITTLSA